MTVSWRTARQAALAAAAFTALCLAAMPQAQAAKTSIVVGMSIEPSGLDPTVAAPVANAQVTWQNVYQGLVRIDRDGKVQPQLAESWTISPDGLTYTFKLRRDANFRTACRSIPASRGSRWTAPGRPTSTNPQKQYYATITSIDVAASDTLVLHLAAPFGDLLFRLGSRRR